jgi:glutamine cyclotransferase
MSQRFLLFFVMGFYAAMAQVSSKPISTTTPTVLRTIPHDTQAFTQGLFYYKGFLYESTGLYGQSKLRVIDPSNGNVIKSVPVPDVFAEGLCRVDSFLVQLTWKEQAAIKYSESDFSVKGSFSYSGEGWGLTYNGTAYIMSNGSDTLFMRNKNFSVIKKIPVTCGNKPLRELNELEYVNGFVYANVWFNTNIYVIQASSGTVVRIIDCMPLVIKNASQSEQDVLNGIAYNKKSQTFYVTGKNWQYIFEVKM